MKKEETICPRREENPHSAYQFPPPDYWRLEDGVRTCSYCGSLHPEDFLNACKSGSELGPTDKDYKVYVEMPNPKEGKRIETGSESGPAYDRLGNPNFENLSIQEKLTKRVHRVTYGRASPTMTKKFYFYHFLSTDQCKGFITLVNEKAVAIGMPGHFYVLPFFMRKGKA